MFLISNTIKITIFARRREIEIMRLVGATNGFIRWPFFLEGLWLGMLGALFPIAALSIVYYNVYQVYEQWVSLPFFELLPFSPFMWQLSGLLLVIGAGIGVWGSVMSVPKFLKV